MSETLHHETDRLCDQVFRVIAGRWTAKGAEIGSFVPRCCSFEEWLNWEAYLALACLVPTLRVSPKAAYVSQGVPCRDLADLLVIDERTDARVMVEVGLVHDGTTSKWVRKLTRDTAKLRRLPPLVGGLQVVVVASNKLLEASRWWTRGLPRVPVWQQPTPFTHDGVLQPAGALHVRAWRLVPSPSTRAT